jgi:hypothetical protein
MKVKVNIREYIEANADHNDMLLVHASVDVDDLFDTNSIPEEAEIDVDIHDLLKQNGMAGIVYSIEDVQSMRPDLNDDQAWEVLIAARDCDTGMTDETIKILADDLYGRQNKSHWQGRIDVSVANYDREAAIEHFKGMASHVERNAVNSTTRATFDPASLRLAKPDESTSN